MGLASGSLDQPKTRLGLDPRPLVFTPFGFTFLPVYWDYALEYRGLLYAPVYYQPALVLRPGFCHRPRYIVCYQDLPCRAVYPKRFVNYFYGDYFRPGYANVGFHFGPAPRFALILSSPITRAINNDRWAREFEFIGGTEWRVARRWFR